MAPIKVTTRLPNSRKLSREKLPQIGEKYNFCRENLHELPCQRMPCPQISQRKLSRIATKLRKICRSFFPQKVSCNTVCKKMILYATFTSIGKFVTWKHYNACQLPMIVWSQTLVEMRLLCLQIHHLWYARMLENTSNYALCKLLLCSCSKLIIQ